MTHETGVRVMAIMSVGADTAYLFGLGTYIGDFLRPGWDHPGELARCEAAILRARRRPWNFNVAGHLRRRMAAGELTPAQATAEFRAFQVRRAAREARPLAEKILELARDMGANPLIQLDAGGFVWGCECWWGELLDGDGYPPRLQRILNGKLIIEVPSPHKTQPSEARHA